MDDPHGIYAHIADPWLWVGFMFPYLAVLMITRVAIPLNRFKRNQRDKHRSAFFVILDLAYIAWVLICIGGPLLFFQWLVGNPSGQPYIAASAINCVPALGLLLWFAHCDLC